MKFGESPKFFKNIFIMKCQRILSALFSEKMQLFHEADQPMPTNACQKNTKVIHHLNKKEQNWGIRYHDSRANIDILCF